MITSNLSTARPGKRLGARLQNSGVILLETVLVLPLMLVLILATAEFSHAFWQYSTLTKAVRDGARFASGQGVLGSTGVVVLTNQLRTDVGNVVVYGNSAGAGSPRLAGLTTAAVTLEAPGDGDVIVRANYPYPALFGVIPTFYGATVTAPFTLDAAVRMRAL